MIPSFVTTAPAIYVLPPIDNNYSTSGSLAVKAATVAAMRRGPVGKPFTITAENWQEICGQPFPISDGLHAEGMRHIEEALSECSSVEVVRAISETAKYPVSFIGPKVAAPEGEATRKPSSKSAESASYQVSSSALPYSEEVQLADKWLAVWPVDGDPSSNRKVKIDQVAAESKTFRISFIETVHGVDKVIAGETFVVSIDPEARDDEGRVMYLPTLLEERASRFRALAINTMPLAQIANGLELKFEGGTNGPAPTALEFVAAWSMFRHPDVSFTLGLAAGSYDRNVLAEAIAVCEGKLAQFRFDAPPTMTETAALEWLTGLNLNSYQAQCYHYPYKATDKWFGGKAIWGVSGAATASKARCLTAPTGRVDVAGAHFSAAGEKRGLISRRGVEALHATGFADPDEMVSKRLNPVTNGTVIGDVLTVWNQQNYLRFEHVGAILNDISHEFLRAARAAKFEPDGLTRTLLNDLAKDICEKRVQSGALVTPRDPEDGESPYVVTVTQIEIDLWQVEIAVCPTGVARRIAMQPILIK